MTYIPYPYHGSKKQGSAVAAKVRVKDPVADAVEAILKSFNIRTRVQLRKFYELAGCTKNEASRHATSLLNKDYRTSVDLHPTRCVTAIGAAIGLPPIDGIDTKALETPLDIYKTTLPSALHKKLADEGIKTRPDLYRTYLEMGCNPFDALVNTKNILEGLFVAATSTGNLPTTAWRLLVHRLGSTPEALLANEPPPEDTTQEAAPMAPVEIFEEDDTPDKNDEPSQVTPDYMQRLEELTGIGQQQAKPAITETPPQETAAPVTAEPAIPDPVEPEPATPQKPPTTRQDTAGPAPIPQAENQSPVLVTHILTKREVFGALYEVPSDPHTMKAPPLPQTDADIPVWPPKGKRLRSEALLPDAFIARMEACGLETDEQLLSMLQQKAKSYPLASQYKRQIMAGAIVLKGTTELNTAGTILFDYLESFEAEIDRRKNESLNQMLRWEAPVVIYANRSVPDALDSARIERKREKERNAAIKAGLQRCGSCICKPSSEQAILKAANIWLWEHQTKNSPAYPVPILPSVDIMEEIKAFLKSEGAKPVPGPAPTIMRIKPLRTRVKKDKPKRAPKKPKQEKAPPQDTTAETKKKASMDCLNWEDDPTLINDDEPDDWGPTLDKPEDYDDTTSSCDGTATGENEKYTKDLDPMVRILNQTIEDNPILTDEQMLALSEDLITARQGLLDLAQQDSICLNWLITKLVHKQNILAHYKTPMEDQKRIEILSALEAHAEKLSNNPDRASSDIDNLPRAEMYDFVGSNYWWFSVHKILKETIPQTGNKDRIASLQKHTAALHRIEHKLILSNQRLIISLIWKSVPYHSQQWFDKLQEGNIGIQKAIRRWDPRVGWRFPTYATYWIRQGMARHEQDTRSDVHIPIHAQELLSRLAKCTADYRRDTGVDPTPKTLAELLHVPVERVLYYQKCLVYQMSLDADSKGKNPTGKSVKDGEKSALKTFIPSNTPTPESLVTKQNLADVIQGALNELTKKQAKVLRMRYFDELTLEDIGKIYGVSRERIRQIESVALKRLRNVDRQEKLKPFYDDPGP